MKKLTILNKLVMLCIVCFSVTTQAQELKVNQLLLPNQAVELARHELPNMLQLIDPEDIKDYGFSLNDNFSSVTIGKPFYVVSLPRMKQPANSDLVEVTAQTVMLPLLLENKARCVLYVSQEEGNWKVVGIGEGNFVAQHQELFNAPQQEDGSSEIIVSIPHLSQQYVLTDSHNMMFTPMITFEGENTQTLTLTQLIDLNNTIALDVEQPLQADENSIENNQPNQSK